MKTNKPDITRSTATTMTMIFQSLSVVGSSTLMNRILVAFNDDVVATSVQISQNVLRKIS
jgi:hypothetical protein